MDYKEEIYLYNGSRKENIKNYCPTTIIKSNSETFIQVIIKFNNNDFRNKIKYIWLKFFWENYGHFGITNKKDCFLVNLDGKKHKPKELIEVPINNDYDAIAIRTDIL